MYNFYTLRFKNTMLTSLTVFFALLGSASVKAWTREAYTSMEKSTFVQKRSNKMLMKLTPGVLIHVLHSREVFRRESTFVVRRPPFKKKNCTFTLKGKISDNTEWNWTIGVDFTNMLMSSFYTRRSPKIKKRQSSNQFLLRLRDLLEY